MDKLLQSIVNEIKASKGFRTINTKNGLLERIKGLIDNAAQTTARPNRPVIHECRPKDRKPNQQGVTVMTSAESAKGDESFQKSNNKKLRKL